MSFLTLEDVNGAIFNNQSFYWVKIDTSEISSTSDFTDVKCDFCKISRETVSGNIPYKFTITVNNSLWTWGYYCYEGSKTVDTTNSILTVTTVEPHIEFFLYMGHLKIETEYKQLNYYLEKDSIDLNYKELQTEQTIKYKGRDSSTTQYSTNVTLSKGYNLIMRNSVAVGYLLVNLVKSTFKFDCTQSVTIGKVNKVCLGTDSEYKPNGAMIGTNTPNINVEYNGEILPVSWDSTLNDYVFDLDLTDKTNIGNIRFKVYIDSNKVINASETTVILQSQYEIVSTFADLVSVCDTGGIKFIQLGADITFTANIPVKHSIKIVGAEHTFNLNSHSIILNEGIQFIAEKISFNNGNTTILQRNNSKVTLTDCNFTNCTSHNYNELGSCIYCDNDLENLDNPNDFETNLINCNFIDNQCCIFHSGQLIVDNCTLHNTDKDYVNTNNVAFVYQTDGYASIRNSIFDIDYDIDDFCTGEINLGFAQCLIMCGETANINGATYIDLQDNNTLPLFEQTIDNQSHLFAKYYYPQLEACVYASPTTNMENKNCCHAVSGVDWIFKNNTQITRVSWDTQNENRLIEWDD